MITKLFSLLNGFGLKIKIILVLIAFIGGIGALAWYSNYMIQLGEHRAEAKFLKGNIDVIERARSVTNYRNGTDDRLLGK